MKLRPRGNAKAGAGTGCDETSTTIRPGGGRQHLHRKAKEKDKDHADKAEGRQALGNAAHREGDRANRNARRGDDGKKSKKKNAKRSRDDCDFEIDDAEKKPSRRRTDKKADNNDTAIKYAIDTAVSKEFVGGKVVGYDANEKLYHVEYEDGDEEELDAKELGQIVIPVIVSSGTSKQGGVVEVSPEGKDEQPLRGDCPDPIDERDADDPQCGTAYIQDMHQHSRSVESRTSARPVYMKKQPSISEQMRGILVDWLVDVHVKFKLVPETLYLTVNIIDRYLTVSRVSRPKLQLVGVTALMIASKYEEIYPPEYSDLVYICDKAYSKDEILYFERTILTKLEYRITIPSAHSFLVRYLKAGHADKTIVQLSCFLLDGTLLSYDLLRYLPSQLAAAVVYVARRTVGRRGWSPTLEKYAQYKEEDVRGVARGILEEKSSGSKKWPKLCSVDKKYGSARYGAVANTELSCDF